MGRDCVLALDLGTTAFKAAPVAAEQVFGSPGVVRYRLDYAEGGVTCPPERYWQSAVRALRGGAKTARAHGLTVRAIGISSQAQTFLALDREGQPLHPAVVWTDDRATKEAAEAAKALPDFARTSGFLAPNPLQFLPKVMRLRRQGFCAERFLLLNEWLIECLTGEAYGDQTNQGMGGFYDITRQAFSENALKLAGIGPENLAKVMPAAEYSATLKTEVCRLLELPPVPVYSCGNDQSVAAVGAGLTETGDVLCNFGTAMVIYALHDRPVYPIHSAAADQIAGISPLPGHWFLLGLESECGNVIDWLARLLYPRRGVPALIEAALQTDIAPQDLPHITLTGSGKLDICHLSVGSRPGHIGRALLELYAARFGELRDGITTPGNPCRHFASGGLSQNQRWLDFLSERHQRRFQRTACEHPALLGIARLITRR